MVADSAVALDQELLGFRSPVVRAAPHGDAPNELLVHDSVILAVVVGFVVTAVAILHVHIRTWSATSRCRPVESCPASRFPSIWGWPPVIRPRLLPTITRAAAGVFLVLLASYVVAGLFVRPAADDWCAAALVSQKGVIGGAIDSYQSWSGRYAATLTAFSAVGAREWVGRVVPGLLMVVWCIAFVDLARGVFWVRQTGERRYWISLALGAGFTVSLIAIAPHQYQSLYWEAGTLAYTAPLVLITLVAGVVVRSSRQGSTAVGLGVIGAASFVAAGFSETATVAMVTGDLAVLLSCRRSRGIGTRQIVPALTTSLVGLALGTLLMIAAPGNAQRLAAMPPHPLLWRALLEGVFFSGYFVAYTILTHLAVVVLVVLTTGAIMYARALQSTTSAGPRRLHWEAGAVLLIAWVFLTCFPAIWVTDGPPPRRGLIVATTEVLIFLAVAGAAAGWSLGASHRGAPRRRAITAGLAAATGGLALSIVTVSALQSTLGSLPAMAAYARAKDAQAAAMAYAALAHSSEAVVPALGDTTRLGVLSHGSTNDDGFGEIGRDSTSWTNTCPGEVFGVAVRVP